MKDKTVVKENPSAIGRKDKFKIRKTLYFIWFKKNISNCITCAILALAICVMAGLISQDTPFLGTIFGTISEAFLALFTAGAYTTVEGWIKIITLVSSLCVLLAVFVSRLKALTGADLDPKSIDHINSMGYDIDTNCAPVKTILGKPVTKEELATTEVKQAQVMIKYKHKTFITDNPISQLFKAGKQIFRITFKPIPDTIAPNNITQEDYNDMANAKMKPIKPVDAVEPEAPEVVDTTETVTPPEESTLPPKKNLFSMIGDSVKEWFDQVGCYYTNKKYKAKEKKLIELRLHIADEIATANELEADIKDYRGIVKSVETELAAEAAAPAIQAPIQEFDQDDLFSNRAKSQPRLIRASIVKPTAPVEAPAPSATAPVAQADTAADKHDPAANVSVAATEEIAIKETVARINHKTDFFTE